jgi:hypothetical protein
MDQSVMSFAGTAARGSAIGTATEGMLTYLADTDAFQFWNGTAWTNTNAGGASSGNILINGAFEINQRGYVSASNLASGAYGFDRWKSTFTNTTLTFTSAPQGQEVTINSGGSIEQVVERQNISAGSYTLSWTGTATGRVYNTGSTPPAYAASPITVTLDGTANVEVEFTASGGTRTLSRVQLEAGTSATAFRRNGSSIEAELLACERYYQLLDYLPATATSSTTVLANATFRTNMRTSPSFSQTGVLNFQGSGSNNATQSSVGLGSIGTSATGAFFYGVPNFSGLSTARFDSLAVSGNNGQRIILNAEL